MTRSNLGRFGSLRGYWVAGILVVAAVSMPPAALGAERVVLCEEFTSTT